MKKTFNTPEDLIFLRKLLEFQIEYLNYKPKLSKYLQFTDSSLNEIKKMLEEYK